MTITTSRVPAVLRQTHSLLSGLVYPSHATSGEVPLVVFGGVVSEATREPIVIQGTLADDSAIDYAALGQVAYDQRFAIRILFGTYIPGVVDGLDVLDRLEEVSNVIQIAFRSQTTGQQAGGFGRNDGNSCECVAWQFARDSYSFDLLKEGVVGECTLDIAFFALI